MEQIEPLHAFEQLKLLSDSRRMHILRLLMAGPATLTQLGSVLRESPAWVRHHVKVLEAAKLIEISEVKVTAGITEKYYKARASALLLQELILPESQKPVIIFSGSHDTAIEHIANQLSRHVSILTLPVGSLDGLVNLRQGLCHVAGAHLLDPSGEYNTPFVRHLFPDRPARLVTLANRTQGLILAPGNPKDLGSLADLSRQDVTFVNRNLGSGTRLWLDKELGRIQLPPGLIRGYEHFVNTHTQSALTVQVGQADAAIGIQAAAWEAQLDFIPLFEERYDLIFTDEQARLLGPLLDHLQTASFRQELRSLTGYNTMHSGEKIPLQG
ncbi:MAG TPA: substrate-binding domain-containing protein [Anaerolineales bacterium]|jgi:putative molybdopterin biosynthesis protein